MPGVKAASEPGRARAGFTRGIWGVRGHVKNRRLFKAMTCFSQFLNTGTGPPKGSGSWLIRSITARDLASHSRWL